MRGRARCKVAAKADPKECKPLRVDFSPRKGIVDHCPDRHLVISPEHHIWVEAEKACLPRAFSHQHVPAALQGSLARLEIQLLPGSIKAGQNNNCLARPSFGTA